MSEFFMRLRRQYGLGEAEGPGDTNLGIISLIVVEVRGEIAEVLGIFIPGVGLENSDAEELNQSDGEQD